MNLSPDSVFNGLTCRAFAPQWSAYLDDALPALMKLRMACHLSTCPDCRRYVRQITMVSDALHMLTKCEPSPVERRFLRERFAAHHAR